MEARFQFLGLPLDALTLKETLDKVERAIEERRRINHTVINAAKVVRAKKDPFLKQSIEESDIINADGQAVVWAARWFKIPVSERVAGIDLMTEVLKLADRKKFRVCFLGATQAVLDEMISKIRSDHPGIKIVWSRNGYFDSTEAQSIAEEIKNANPDILFVGMPTPYKERFIHDYSELMNVPFAMGVGGSFDVLSGKTRRAPVWMQKIGMEWFFRLSQEPRRLFMRYAVTNVEFVCLVVRDWYETGYSK